MATVSLQTVFDAARRALETGAADKAIGIAQHILVHYPRMIEGHRLLGEAYLNANEPEQAAAAFEQVLQADPENVAAYYGLGLAQQSLDQRPAAISAFERALEIQPNLADLRTQLMRLYSETPGSAGQFRLSRAGLGRLYARGGMYGQAIDEFRAVLDGDPNRDDVKVALAEALWRDSQEDEATDFCRDILERRPDLLKPTVLLGYMLFASGQPEGEVLWRRAAEQDATMALASTLFDILPPIRIEDPVLPEFDEAEWRAQEARRVAEQPAQAPVAAAALDDDFFADSWLSSAGTAAAAGGAAAAGSAARIYAAPATPEPSAAGSDDDLLASLLGFADAPAPPPAQAEASLGGVQPFALDDWGLGETESATSALPSSLDEIGLSEPRQTPEPESVKPFSLDDWGFDEAPPAPSAPSASQPANDFELSGIEAFSLDDESDPFGTAKPFSFDEEPAGPANVTPFSLDESDDLGGIQPFSFESEAPAADARAGADAGLGSVQPFSLDDWGLDDAAPSSGGSAPAGQQDDQLDGLGDFKPFSLDELSLDALDGDASSTLSGPQFTDEPDATEDSSGFSWEEPSWRSQQTTNRAPEAAEGESIFAKLMRNRSQEPPAAEPHASEPEPQLDDDLPNFFSLDEEPLRLEDSANQFSDSRSGLLDDIGQQQADAPVLGDESASSDRSSVFPAAASGLAADLSANTNEPQDIWSLGETGETDTTFSWDQPGQAAEQPADEPMPFSLSDLGLDDDELTGLGAQFDQPAQAAEQPAEPAPFSLSDLGLDDDELAGLGAQFDQPVADTPEQPAPDALPFSLSDLGLADEELAAWNLSTNTSAGAEPATPEAVADTEPVVPQASAETADDQPDMTPFSLADLGLSEDELALLEGAREAEQMQAETPDAAFDMSDLFDDPAPEAPQASATEPPAFDANNFFESTTSAAPADAHDSAAFSAFDTSDLFGTLPEPDRAETAEPSAFSALDTSDLFDTSRAAPEQPAAGEMEIDWATLQASAPAADEMQDVFAAADAEQPSPATTPEPNQPAATDEPDMTPFSLADLGLSADELMLFEQVQRDQADAAPSTEAAASGEDASFLFQDTSADQADAPFSWEASEPPALAMTDQPFSSSDIQGTDLPDLTEPFALADRATSDEAACDELFTFDGPLGTAQPAVDDPFVQADVAAPTPSAALESSMPTLPESDTPAETGPAIETALPLPMDLPEGAQSVASAAVAQPPSPPAYSASAGTGADEEMQEPLAAIRAQLAAQPQNYALHLAAARMNLHTAHPEQSVEHYKQLIKNGELLDDVVDDLQDTIADTDDPQLLRRLHRLLGDAYMKQNRFREAMDEYSWTLARRS